MIRLNTQFLGDVCFLLLGLLGLHGFDLRNGSRSGRRYPSPCGDHENLRSAEYSFPVHSHLVECAKTLLLRMGVYLIVMASYFGFIYPDAPDVPLVVVFGVAGLNVLITFYDVVICRCKGIYQRTGERYAVPFKNNEG